MNDFKQVRIVIHAPSVQGLSRARRSAAELSRLSEEVAVRIVVSDEAVAATLNNPAGLLDRLTLVCPGALQRLARVAPKPLTVLEETGALALARMQQDGWRYVRA